MRRVLLAVIVASFVLAWPAQAQLFPTTPSTEPKPTAIPIPANRSAWLDEPKRDWNTPGMAVPVPPPDDKIDPTCLASLRPPETAEDDAVVAAGWSLNRGYRAGWGLKIVHAFASTGGMCRPDDYNEFVFVDGLFIGTISPYPMRTISGSPGQILSWNGDSVMVEFKPYRAGDPNCCPSGTPVVMVLKVDRTPGAAVLRRD